MTLRFWKRTAGVTFFLRHHSKRAIFKGIILSIFCWEEVWWSSWRVDEITSNCHHSLSLCLVFQTELLDTIIYIYTDSPYAPILVLKMSVVIFGTEIFWNWIILLIMYIFFRFLLVIQNFGGYLRLW